MYNICSSTFTSCNAIYGSLTHFTYMYMYKMQITAHGVDYCVHTFTELSIIASAASENEAKCSQGQF